MVIVTPLGYALIGLMVAQPRSGYDLRKVFEFSPLGVYSSSPGSIYPVLAKLVAAGLAEKRPVQSNSKKIFHATAKGRATLKTWLKQPVDVEDVARDIDTVLLRFAFLETASDLALTRRFLASFENAVAAHLAALHAFMESDAGKALSRHGRLAMENGIAGFENQLKWARSAKASFSRKNS